MEIRRLGPGDERELERAGPCMDEPVQAAAATRFLNSEDHHVLVAYDGDSVAGFVTGVELTHPDKGTEMFLYELGVDTAFRGQGCGAALVRALAALARERECYGLWVLTDDDNEAALATYRAAGATRTSPSVMLSWDFDPSDSPVTGGGAGR